jgi:hypothetical protein
MAGEWGDKERGKERRAMDRAALYFHLLLRPVHHNHACVRGRGTGKGGEEGRGVNLLHHT